MHHVRDLSENFWISVVFRQADVPPITVITNELKAILRVDPSSCGYYCWTSPVDECTFCITFSLGYTESTLIHRWCPAVISRLVLTLTANTSFSWWTNTLICSNHILTFFLFWTRVRCTFIYLKPTINTVETNSAITMKPIRSINTTTII